jgi:predicted dehydrogenase
MAQVRFGIVGTGGMGSGHAKTMQSIEECKLAAVCDIVPEVAEAVGRAVQRAILCTDYHDLIDHPGRRCRRGGYAPLFPPRNRHLCHGTGQAGHLGEAHFRHRSRQQTRWWPPAKRTGTPFAVMYQSRTEPIWQAAWKLVKSGQLGEIYRTMLVYADFRSQAYYNSAGWRATWAGEGGGVLINQAPHIRWIASPGWPALPNKVTAYTRHRQPQDRGGGRGRRHVGPIPTGPRALSTAPQPKCPAPTSWRSRASWASCGSLGSVRSSSGASRIGVKAYSDWHHRDVAAPRSHEVEVELPECESGHGGAAQHGPPYPVWRRAD